MDVTVLDRTNHHLFQPLLYQVATGILSEGEIAPATRGILARQRNATVLLGEVVDIDLERRVVVWKPPHPGLPAGPSPDEPSREQPYDSLIVAAGSGTSYFGHQDFAAFAPGLKTIDDAVELRSRILHAFEMAEETDDEASRRRWLTFVVVGGGPTGVEMAGQIAELSKRTLRHNFRNFDPAAAKVILVDAVDHVLPSFGDHLSERAARELRRLGVELRLGTMVTGVDATGVDLERAGTATRVECMVKVWAAGVRASPLGAILAKAAGATLDRAGRVEVGTDCRLPGHPDVWVIGDLMALAGLPGVAEVAIQTGIHAAREIRRHVAADPAREPAKSQPFKYRDLGSMASVARFHAVASVGPLRLAGFGGWVLWAFVHLAFLTGFKNRVSALAHWGVSFVGRGRSERTIRPPTGSEEPLRHPG